MNATIQPKMWLLILWIGGFLASSCNEKRETELIFTTAFDYKFEKKEGLNFQETAEANGLDASFLAVKAWKQDRTWNFVLDPERYLSHYLAQLIVEDKLAVEVEGKRIGKEEVQAQGLLRHYDTTVINRAFESGHVITSDEVWKEWESFKIKQAWTYNQETKQLSCFVIDVAPVYYDQLERKIERFSIPFNQEKDGPNSIRNILNDPSNIWIKETSNFVSLDEVELLDGTGVDIKTLFWSDPLEGKVKVFFKNYQGLIEDFDIALLQRPSADTIFTFDPITFEEKIEVRTQAIPVYEDIIGYNIEQLWYFDQEALKLKCQLKGIEPLVKDAYENKLRALFYLK